MAHHAEGAAEDPHQRENIDADDQRKVSGAAPQIQHHQRGDGEDQRVFGVARFGGSAGSCCDFMRVALLLKQRSPSAPVAVMRQLCVYSRYFILGYTHGAGVMLFYLRKQLLALCDQGNKNRTGCGFIYLLLRNNANFNVRYEKSRVYLFSMRLIKENTAVSHQYYP